MRILALILATAIFATATAAQIAETNLPPELKSFVEPDTKAIAVETADLNGDGTKDFALVLEKLTNAPDEDQGERLLLIVTRGKDNKFSVATRSDKAVYCRTCGGVFGDPFEGLTVGSKTFTVHHYGGSAWRWANQFKFNYSRVDKTWQLVKVSLVSYHNSEPNKMTTKTFVPPKDFGKINLSDFNPERFTR